MTTDAPADITPPADLGGFIAGIKDLHAQAPADGPPAPLVAGTFVLYPMADGGLMGVMSVVEGAMAGEHRMRLAPGMLRALGILAGGGSKIAALKALTRGQ